MESRGALLLILLAATLWGTAGTAQTFAPSGASPIIVGTMRLAIGGFVLFLYALMRMSLSRSHLFDGPTMLAAVSMASYQLLFFSAVAQTGVAVGTMVAIGSSPILAGLLEWVYTNRFPAWKWWVSTMVAITGCVCLVTSSQEVTIDITGIVLAVGAGLSFAAYTMFNKNLLQTKSPEAVVGVVFTCSAIMLTPLLFIYDTAWLFQMNGVLVALHLGLIATALPYHFYTKGLKNVPSSFAVTLALAEPLTATILGVFLLDEVLTPVAWTGVFLIFFALLLLSFSPGKRRGWRPGISRS
ncbi:DMT family transporter [Thalassobacillus pellis]|uniref:DMT family transporter n=1 Tax=Thalassobacillus pellis TaxID=748008 RepID=UPI0019608857|nr:DMT family transporter [Thalassobacillus pellis]MBM7553868.1 DME family drug/metabolite transporter [Thalassobacillus pellis]